MALSDILTQVHRRSSALSRRLDDPKIGATVHDNPLLCIYAEQGAREIAIATGRAEGRATITIVAGTYEYDVALDMYAPINAVLIVGTTHTTLDPISGVGARAEAAAQTANDTPDKYGFYAGKLYLNKPPADAGTLDLYYVKGSLYAEDDSNWTSTDNPAGDLVDIMPPEFERPLADYILGHWFYDIGLGDHARQYLLHYEEDLERLKQHPRRPKIYYRSPHFFR